MRSTLDSTLAWWIAGVTGSALASPASVVSMMTITGFVLAWAWMTNPNTFHRMLGLDSPRIYLLIAAAAGDLVGVRSQPRLACLREEVRAAASASIPTISATDAL